MDSMQQKEIMGQSFSVAVQRAPVGEMEPLRMSV